jgi:hypothetical protein
MTATLAKWVRKRTKTPLPDNFLLSR